MNPKKSDISVGVKHFFCTLIRYESISAYVAFARELNTHIKTELKIKLPADAQGNPDYQFMDNYMKTRPFSVNVE